jgi:hypothetical protein
MAVLAILASSLGVPWFPLELSSWKLPLKLQYATAPVGIWDEPEASFEIVGDGSDVPLITGAPRSTRIDVEPAGAVTVLSGGGVMVIAADAGSNIPTLASITVVTTEARIEKEHNIE